MDRSKGGYVIIDLTSLPLSATEEATAITSPEILKQLLELNEYGLYSKKSLKPIYLRALDSNGVEVVSLCELDRNNGVLRIKAFIMDSVLVIYVAYDIDSETQEVLIDSATYEYVSEHDKIASIIGEGDIENAKPLYWHGILMQSKNSGSLYTITLIIINNDSEKINTWAKLKQIFIDFGNTALINANGFYNYNNEDISNVAFIYISSTNFILVGNNSLNVRNDVSKTFATWDAIFGEEGSVIEDRVNKIN